MKDRLLVNTEIYFIGLLVVNRIGNKIEGWNSIDDKNLRLKLTLHNFKPDLSVTKLANQPAVIGGKPAINRMC